MKINIVFFFVALSFFTGCNNNLPPDAVAQIGDKIFTVDEFLDSKFAVGIENKPESFVRSRVESFVEQSVIIQDAYAKGLNKSRDVSKPVSIRRRALSINDLYRQKIINIVITDSLLYGAYDQSKWSYRISQIVLKNRGSDNSRTKQQTLDRAEKILEKIRSGKQDFSAMVSQYSESPSSGEFGDEGFVEWNRMMPEFLSVVPFLAVGEISVPVFTKNAVHLVMLTEKKALDIPSFEETKEMLTQILAQVYREQVIDRENTVTEQILDKHQFEINGENVRRFIKEKRAYREKESVKKRPPLSTKDLMKKLNEISPLATYEGGHPVKPTWFASEFEERSDYELEMAIKDSLSVAMTIRSILLNEFLFKEAKHLEIHTSEAVEAGVKKHLDVAMYNHYNKNILGRDLEVSGDEILEYYNSNPDRFMSKDLVEIYEIFVNDSSLAVKIRADLDAGADFSVLADQHTERKPVKGRGGLLPPIARGQYGELGQKAFEAEIGGLVGPFRLKIGWSIFKLNKRKPSAVNSFNRVKKQAKVLLVKEKKLQRRLEEIDDLYEKYNIKINKNLISSGEMSKKKEVKQFGLF